MSEWAHALLELLKALHPIDHEQRYIFYSDSIANHAGSCYWKRNCSYFNNHCVYQWKAQAVNLKSNKSQKENHLNEFSSSLAVSDAVILIIIIIIIVVICERRNFFITNSFSHCCLNQSHPFMCKLFYFGNFVVLYCCKEI
jgi:hypothetical protein